MKIQCKGRCRGDGKLYSLLALEGFADPRVESLSPSGIVLPSCLVNLGNGEYVLVLAGFSVGQEVCVFEKGSKEDGITWRETPKQYAFESKANGLLKRVVCDRIRNIDKPKLESEFVLEPTMFFSQDGESYMSAVASGEGMGDLESAVLYDRNGEERARLDSKDFYGSSCEDPRSTNFSFSYEGKDEWLCVFVRSVRGFVSFIVLRENQLKKLNRRASWANESSFDRCGYASWFAQNRISDAEAAKQKALSFDGGPKFSIIVPLYKTPLSLFEEMADSVVAQTYANWELVLVNSTPEIGGLKGAVDRYAAADSRIRVVELDGNLGITENTNKGVEVAEGDYLCFFDHDDVLEPDILFEYAMAIQDNPEINLLYCDEDKLFPTGDLGNPTFKPSFSLDMARDNNYICHLLTVKASVYHSLPRSGRELDGAQDHATVLKIAELGGLVHHVPKVLYHWRMTENSTAQNSDSKPYATEAGVRAVQQHLDRMGVKAVVSCAHGRAFRYKVDYDVVAGSLTSVIVSGPFNKSYFEGLCQNLSSLKSDQWELVVLGGDGVGWLNEVISSSGVAERTKLVLGRYQTCLATQLNEGVSSSEGDVLLFLNGPVQPMVECGDWLSVLSGFALREDVGVVGAKICNPDRTIKSAGVTYIGDSFIEESPDQPFDSPGYIYYPQTVRNVATVDPACFACSRASFDSLGGFDEDYSGKAAVVDFCFRVDRLGVSVVYTPEAEFVKATTSLCLEREEEGLVSVEDKLPLLGKWASKLSSDDPWISPNFSRDPYKRARFLF